MRKCKVHVCPRDVRTDNLCAAHYLQMYNYCRITKEDIGPYKPRKSSKYKRRNVGKCVSDGCDRKQLVNHMCAFHNQKMYRDRAKERIWQSIRQFNSSQTSTY